MMFTFWVSVLRTRQHRACRVMRRCSSLRAWARCVLSPCLTRQSRYWRARSTAVS